MDTLENLGAVRWLNLAVGRENVLMSLMAQQFFLRLFQTCQWETDGCFRDVKMFLNQDFVLSGYVFKCMDDNSTADIC